MTFKNRTVYIPGAVRKRSFKKQIRIRLYGVFPDVSAADALTRISRRFFQAEG